MFSLSATGRAAALLSLVTLAAACTPPADQPVINAVKTVNGVGIDAEVLNVYLETRLGKSADEVTEDERENALSELTDLYLLTTQPRAVELAGEPRARAQLEIQRRGLIANLAVSDYIENNQATEEEIVAEYEDQVQKAPPKQFKARHILVDTQEEATALIEELKGGADFAELAQENSTGPSGPNGGDLGWFPPEQMVKPFSDAVDALEDGAFTQEPVETQFGWHVILREDSRIAEPPTLESVREVIKQRVEQVKLQNYLESLRGEEPG